MLTEERASNPLDAPKFINRIVVPILRGAWQTATAYKSYDAVNNDGTSYISFLAHTSGASTEPGVGGSWQTVWFLWSEAGDDAVPEARLAAVEALAAANKVRIDATQIRVNFDTTTTDGDPGTGDVRLNTGAYATATEIYIDDVDVDAVDISAAVAAWLHFEAGTVQGRLKLIDRDDPEKWAEYRLHDVIDASGYTKLTVEHVASAGALFANGTELVLTFEVSEERDALPVERIDPEFAYARRGENGRVIEAVGHDGSLHTGLIKQAPSVNRGLWIQTRDGPTDLARDRYGISLQAWGWQMAVFSGQAWYTCPGNPVWQQMTFFSTDTVAAAWISEGVAHIVRASKIHYKCRLTGDYSQLNGSASTIVLAYLTGQSNAAGSESLGVMNATPFSDRFIMHRGGNRPYGNWIGSSQIRTDPQIASEAAIHDFKQGFEEIAGGAGETSLSGRAWGVLNGGELPSSYAILGSCVALGGAEWPMLFRTGATVPAAGITYAGQPWDNFESQFIRDVMFFRLHGRRVIVGAQAANLGESHIGGAASVIEGFEDTRADDWLFIATEWGCLPAVSDPGFEGVAPVITTQTCSGNFYTVVTSQVPVGQLNVNRTDPERFLCCGPTYDQTYAGDGVHLLAAGQEMQGARQAAAENFWLSGGEWFPLCIRTDAGHEPVFDGTDWVCEIWNVLGLDLETVDFGLGADLGVKYSDSGSRTNSTTVIVDDTHIKLMDWTGGAAGSSKKIRCGMNGTSGSSAGPTTGNRTEIRTEASGQTTRGGLPVHHYLCIDEVALP